MFNKKCSIPDCDITASSLLTSITTGKVNLHVCPKHIKKLGLRLKNRGKLDYRFVNKIQLLGKPCKICSLQADYLIETNHPIHNETYLCHNHIVSSFCDQLSIEEYQILKASHSEIALHRIPEFVLI